MGIMLRHQLIYRYETITRLFTSFSCECFKYQSNDVYLSTMIFSSRTYFRYLNNARRFKLSKYIKCICLYLIEYPHNSKHVTNMIWRLFCSNTCNYVIKLKHFVGALYFHILNDEIH